MLEKSPAQVLITVVIPCYNHGAYLWDAIRSVENSGFRDYEMIIVDDGSTDPETQRIAKEVQEAGYHIILQNNQGVAASRNNAIKLAKGKYIIPLDADNKLLAPYFFEGVKILDENPKVGVVYGDALIIGEKSGSWKNHPMVMEEILFENNIDTCTIIRKKMWEEVGGYDTNAPVPTRQDYLFWLDCIKHNWAFHYLPQFCFEYRFLDGSEVRKYFRISAKRIAITEYLYSKQIPLIDKAVAGKQISVEAANHLKGRLRSQLSNYHLSFGSVLKGYRYFFESFIYPNDALLYLRIAIGWPIKRLRNR
ncbi:MAG TPA: glycosyltransferase [Catalimonadaceae bacterium]|nr:glycosyltransferase [Catalimonadaceae bacterium]HPI10493.1 glycosyltransferase [Catalimonadaceae bacterium]